MKQHLIKGVPFISQLIKYPTGCESVAAVMALQYLGYEKTVDEFIDHVLDKGQKPVLGEDGRYYGDDPWKCFPGTPYSMEDGWGCFAPVIENAIAKIPGYETEVFYGKSLEELKFYLEKDIPVVFWATIECETPRKSILWITPEGKEIQWISPMHCTLLIGYDESGFIFNDPTSGEAVHFDTEKVRTAYEGQGMQALIIHRK